MHILYNTWQRCPKSLGPWRWLFLWLCWWQHFRWLPGGRLVWKKQEVHRNRWPRSWPSLCLYMARHCLTPTERWWLQPLGWMPFGSHSPRAAMVEVEWLKRHVFKKKGKKNKQTRLQLCTMCIDFLYLKTKYIIRNVARFCEDTDVKHHNVGLY